jgi:hypothetical protein
MRCAVGRSHCWLASTISGAAVAQVLAHRATRSMSSRAVGLADLELDAADAAFARGLARWPAAAPAACAGSRPRCCSRPPRRAARPAAWPATAPRGAPSGRTAPRRRRRWPAWPARCGRPEAPAQQSLSTAGRCRSGPRPSRPAPVPAHAQTGRARRRAWRSSSPGPGGRRGSDSTNSIAISVIGFCRPVSTLASLIGWPAAACMARGAPRAAFFSARSSI